MPFAWTPADSSCGLNDGDPSLLLTDSATHREWHSVIWPTMMAIQQPARSLQYCSHNAIVASCHGAGRQTEVTQQRWCQNNITTTMPLNNLQPPLTTHCGSTSSSLHTSSSSTAGLQRHRADKPMHLQLVSCDNDSHRHM